MNNFILTIGALTILAGGFLLAGLFLYSTGIFLSVVGQRFYNRLRRIYQLNVIWYWLNRLESEGTHCFQKAEIEELK